MISPTLYIIFLLLYQVDFILNENRCRFWICVLINKLLVYDLECCLNTKQKNLVRRGTGKLSSNILTKFIFFGDQISENWYKKFYFQFLFYIFRYSKWNFQQLFKSKSVALVLCMVWYRLKLYKASYRML